MKIAINGFGRIGRSVFRILEDIPGIDVVAVNDVFVMKAWGKASGVDGKVLMLADGNGDYAKALGLAMDASKFGMGQRAQRFAMLVKDGVVTQLHVGAPGDFKVSAADYVLARL